MPLNDSSVAEVDSRPGSRQLLVGDVGVDGHGIGLSRRPSETGASRELARQVEGDSLERRGDPSTSHRSGRGRHRSPRRPALGRRGAGGDADAVGRPRTGQAMSRAPSISRASRAAGALGHLDQPQGVGAIAGAHHQQTADVGDRLDRLLAVGGGVADVLLAGPTMSGSGRCRTATISAVSSTDRVVWVTKARLVGVARPKARASATVSIRVTAPSGSWPMVPTTSGWPAWPISRISRPSRSGARPRGAPWRPAGRWRRGRTGCAALASAGTALGTPWAEKITGRSVSGHLVEFLHEDGALRLQGSTT